MNQPVFKNADIFQVHGFREWIRKNMPSGPQGFVVEDLDLVPRVYGPSYGTDEKGKFALMELKYGRAQPARAQINTFGLIDGLLKNGDPQRKRYRGYHVLNYTNEDWARSEFMLNGKPITLDKLARFLLEMSDEFGEWFK